MIRQSILLSIVVLFIGISSVAWAGGSIVDKPVKAGGLWCLPDSSDPLQFRYLPASARLARNEDGKPFFGLVYYTEPGVDKEDAHTIDEADGGALLNFMVEYFTPKHQVRRASRALKDIVSADAELVGPVVFDDGTYSLISATTNDARVRFADGKAPVLSGSKVPISIRLDKEQAKVLGAALTSSTPDLSLVFDMSYSGVRSSFDADVVIDWEKASQSLDRGVKAGISVYGIGVGGEIEQAVSKMLNNGALRIEVRGDDANMEALIASIQQSATELFFTPLEDVEADDNFGQIGSPDMASTAGVNRYFSINAQVKYKVKDIATTGQSVISLRKAAAATRRWLIVFDAGEVSKNLLNDPEFVRVEDISNHSMSVRNVVVKPDVSWQSQQNSDERLIKSVNVELVKTHSDGRETFRLIHFSGEDLDNRLSRAISYPRYENEAWDNWLQYRYRSVWEFKNQPTSETPWQTVRADEIALDKPYKLTTIQPLGDLRALADRGIRAVIVEVSYPLFGQSKSVLKTALTTETSFDSFSIPVSSEATLFTYTITHIGRDGLRKSYQLNDRAGFAVFDQAFDSSTGSKQSTNQPIDSDKTDQENLKE